jgi:hypothetical protein
MTIGAMDNGMLIYVGEQLAGYVAYAAWGAARRVPAGNKSLFDVLRVLFYDGGNAGEYAPVFAAARDYIERDLIRLDAVYGNPFFPVPDGTNVKLREGRHGGLWGLLEACAGIARACELHPGDALSVEQVFENAD